MTPTSLESMAKEPWTDRKTTITSTIVLHKWYCNKYYTTPWQWQLLMIRRKRWKKRASLKEFINFFDVRVSLLEIIGGCCWAKLWVWCVCMRACEWVCLSVCLFISVYLSLSLFMYVGCLSATSLCHSLETCQSWLKQAYMWLNVDCWMFRMILFIYLHFCSVFMLSSNACIFWNAIDNNYNPSAAKMLSNEDKVIIHVVAI